MGQSYRIRTEIGVNKTINVQLDQDFEFLEILSLAIQQTDIYIRACADYGVIVGRVTANNGFGIPNARVSVFIPIEQVDESNPIISSIYPYKSPNDINEDGYRYNLLPYESSHSGHRATGTLPTRTDALTGSTAVELYDKYYKFTSKTNESGDYMIMGVPVGTHQLVMDVDLSDIGEFSLTPQDLIRMGRATEAQVAGNRFRTSSDLNSLPQIVNLTKTLEVAPLWGDQNICQIAINRVDFDLREEASIDIQPTAVFMGSIFSSPNKFRVRRNCKPRDNMGNLCNLVAGPGQILALRQTTQQDSDGNPILEQYELEQSGNIIDGSGSWLTELPMNLEYVTTNEFGEKVLSNDPAVGIPTKGKYRFKIKWQQPPTLTEQVRRGYFLVPNVKEYGWDDDEDPNILSSSNISINQRKQLGSSYYFGLAWSGYTNGFTGQNEIDRLTEIINCSDTFYEFQFNRVYTVSGFIDQWKKGNARGRFIGIKEIDDDNCSSTVNKFPVNDGFRNFDFLFFLFSILLTILSPTFLILIIVAHIAFFVYNLLLRLICILTSFWPLRWIRRVLGVKCDKKDYTLRLPMINYPDCEACECKSDYTTKPDVTPKNPNTNAAGLLTYLSLPETYQSRFEQIYGDKPLEFSILASETLSGFAVNAFKSDSTRYKIPKSQTLGPYGAYAFSLPLGERINIYNSRKSYFEGINKIKVQVEPSINLNKHHYDNTITVLSNTQYSAGDLITMVSPSSSMDSNFNWSSNTINGVVTGISGTPYTSTAATAVTMTYAINPFTSQSVNYTLPYGTDEDNYKFPADIEYFQVVTAITWGDIIKIWNPNTPESFPNILTGNTNLKVILTASNFTLENTDVFPIDMIEDISEQYVLVLQRGVDPYSPKYQTKYQLGNLFGTGESDPNFTFTAATRLNIPIQKNSNTSLSIQAYNQNEMFFQSYFFKPGVNGSSQTGQVFSAYTTINTGYYGLQDVQNYDSDRFTTAPLNMVITRTNNELYSPVQLAAKYDESEDLSGLAGMSIKYNGTFLTTLGKYYSKTFYGGVSYSAMTINNSVKNVMRTDRLPSSDVLDGGSWDNNPSLLQQNLNFQMYLIDAEGEDISTPAYTTGADIVTADLEGLDNSVKVIESFSCDKMVALNCYKGFGGQFQIDQNCIDSDAVERGCYVFIRRLILDIPKDIVNFSEWSYRFRFFYALCRGVLSQSFMNNWVNGTLYAFPIQVDTFYDRQNKPYSRFCESLIYYDMGTTNFYYRSSPWQGSVKSGKFIGKPAVLADGAINKRNLLFPSTIMNLGLKDSFYDEISFDPSTKGYVMTELDNSSYGDVSDLINLFVISRITDATFLQQLFSAGDNSINQLFSRDNYGGGKNYRRIDGDLAQLMSINSEIGNIKFSPEYYETDPLSTNNPATILGTASDPVVAVWFSSTTENLQTKDFLSPGRINFRATPTSNFTPYPYSMNSQLVPFYRWDLKGGQTIFGTQYNNWLTDKTEIVQKNYQSLDRVSFTSPTYFQSSFNNSTDLPRRGYIFAQDNNGTYLSVGYQNRKFVVGAPFHFYFGVIQGESALDKFKTKYSISE